MGIFKKLYLALPLRIRKAIHSDYVVKAGTFTRIEPAFIGSVEFVDPVDEVYSIDIKHFMA